MDGCTVISCTITTIISENVRLILNSTMSSEHLQYCYILEGKIVVNSYAVKANIINLSLDVGIFILI